MQRGIARAFRQSDQLLSSVKQVVPPAQRVLDVHDFGNELIDYTRGLQIQEDLAKKRLEGSVRDTLIQLQHTPVYSVGKRGQERDLLTSHEELAALGATVFESPRGGQVTFHGPGQLVVYPIVSLRELGVGARAYVEGLEDVIIRTAGVYGLQARGRVKCRTGVWIGNRKLAAIGVRISQGIATHGIALNVSTDLTWFDHIVGCGIKDLQMTSLERELGRELSMEQVAQQFDTAFRTTFGYHG